MHNLQQQLRHSVCLVWIVLLLWLSAPRPTLSYDASDLPPCYTPCENFYSGEEAVPGTDCKLYHVCFQGEIRQRVGCGEDMLFNPYTKYCDYKWLVRCDLEPTCPPTMNPSISPTESPSNSPTTTPTKAPSTTPTTTPTSTPSFTPTFAPTYSEFTMPLVRQTQSLLEKYVFISYTSAGIAYASVRYTYDGFVKALTLMSVKASIPDYQFFLANEAIYGLVNLGAFLANSMVETIQYDTCDELNWQAVAGRYAISNSCGQQGRSYQDEVCETNYSCPVDTEMKTTAVDSGKGARDPPPFTCRPGSGIGYYSGYWATSTGSEITDTPYASVSGRTDVEGCCWWGRGALLTRNVCNIGKINYFLGSKAAEDGRESLYPNTNFCKFPEAICSSTFSDEMVWSVAMFEWADRVQRYQSSPKNEWTYENQLRKFVDGGMTDDSFIMSVARILTNGCHDVGCSTMEVRMKDTRKQNFYLIINDIFKVKYFETQKPSRSPVQKSKPSIWTATSSTSTTSTDRAPAVSWPTPVVSNTATESDLSPQKSPTYEPTSFDALLILVEGNSAWIGQSSLISLVFTLVLSIVLSLSVSLQTKVGQ